MAVEKIHSQVEKRGIEKPKAGGLCIMDRRMELRRTQVKGVGNEQSGETKHLG